MDPQLAVITNTWASARALGSWLAHAHRQGHTWRHISRVTGIPVTTAWRRARPYLDHLRHRDAA